MDKFAARARWDGMGTGSKRPAIGHFLNISLEFSGQENMNSKTSIEEDRGSYPSILEVGHSPGACS